MKLNYKNHKGSLYLRSLTSAKDLTLPTTINGNLYLDYSKIDISDSFANKYKDKINWKEFNKYRAKRIKKTIQDLLR